MIPRHRWQGMPLSPHQFFSAGFRDGMRGKTHHPLFLDSPKYLNGYTEGYRDYLEQLLIRSADPQKGRAANEDG